MDKDMKAYGAEFLGTFTLCFVGQGAICAQQMIGASGLLSIAVAHGLALAVMISALGAISGAHFNPAVSFGFFMTGRQSARSMFSYWAAQILGAVVASFLLRAVYPTSIWEPVHLGAPSVHASIPLFGAFVAEFVATFFLVAAVWGTAVDERHPPIGGFGIGLAVTMGILAIGPATGAALNPARAIGPALVSNSWGAHWVYWVGPLLGAGAAAMLYDRYMMPGRGSRGRKP